MTIKELEERACRNKEKAIKEARKAFVEWLKALYKDCEEDLKRDRERHPFVFPDNYTAFDLFSANLAQSIEDCDEFSSIDFIKKARDLHTAENTDIKEYFY